MSLPLPSAGRLASAGTSLVGLLPLLLAGVPARLATQSAPAAPVPASDSAPAVMAPVPARQRYRHDRKLTSEYDRFTDSTHVVLELESRRTGIITCSVSYVVGCGRLALVLSSEFRGKEPERVPPSVLLEFRRERVESTAGGGERPDYMEFVADSIRFRVPVIAVPDRLDGNVRKITNRVALTTGRLMQLAGARQFLIRLGNWELGSTSDHENALRDFATRVVPGQVDSVRVEERSTAATTQAVAVAPSSPAQPAVPADTTPTGSKKQESASPSTLKASVAAASPTPPPPAPAPSASPVAPPAKWTEAGPIPSPLLTKVWVDESKLGGKVYMRWISTGLRCSFNGTTIQLLAGDVSVREDVMRLVIYGRPNRGVSMTGIMRITGDGTAELLLKATSELVFPTGFDDPTASRHVLIAFPLTSAPELEENINTAAVRRNSLMGW